MGQRQRVRLAMAFLHRPRIVLLDEPHTSLDDDGLALLRGATIAIVIDVAGSERRESAHRRGVGPVGARRPSSCC